MTPPLMSCSVDRDAIGIETNAQITRSKTQTGCKSIFFTLTDPSHGGIQPDIM